MRSTDPRLRVETVNEGMMVLPNPSAWEELRADPQIDGASILTPKLAWASVHFCNKHSACFAVGLYQYGPSQKKWAHCVLYRVGEAWQRVHLERLSCADCGWKGMTATPLLSDLYLGVPDKEKVMQLAAKIPVVQCPVCGGLLPPRHPIWAEAAVAA
jgi:hypothetical protein